MLTFDENEHKYYIDGVAVPSVTQLVAPLGADYDEPDDYLETVVDYAAERGTTLHAYIAWRLQGGVPEEFEIPDVYQGYADAVEAFLEEHEIFPLLIETPLEGEGYAGTPDLVADVDGFLTILDYKFVSQVAKSKVGAQLSGYRLLCERINVFPERLAAVQFMATGKYRLYPVEDAASAITAFELCKAINRIKGRKHTRGKIF